VSVCVVCGVCVMLPLVALVYFSQHEVKVVQTFLFE
jgi:hypothetical protein